MKKVLILALLALGCKAGTVEQTTPTPPPPPVVEAANPYEGTYTFLLSLMEVEPAGQFVALCEEAGGAWNSDGKYTTCMAGGAGFAIEVESGTVIGSSLLIPSSEAQLVANALVDEIGPPTAVDQNAAVWELDGLVLVFAPATNTHFIIILQRTGTLL